MFASPMFGVVGIAVEQAHRISQHRTDVGQLREGCHIYVFRIGLTYTHHGIYIGDGRVIHFIGPKAVVPSCKQCGFLRRSQHGVVETCLDCFLCGGFLHVYRYGIPKRVFDLSGRTLCPTCAIMESKPDFEVVQAAKQKLKEGFGNYDLLSNNCESFATFCATGKSFCQQVVRRAILWPYILA